jgi:flagellar basal-body rod protein FlgF
MMQIGFYAAALGSLQQEKKLNVIANNLANANTPGYKRDGVLFSNYLAERTSVLMDQGPIRETGNQLDVALSGSGLLEVQADNGTLYTRAGDLKINKENVLVTQQGWPVLGQGGPIKFSNLGADIRIDRTGQVFDGKDRVDTLNIVQFPQGTGYEKVKYGYLRPRGQDLQPAPAADCTVQQGALEGANFETVQEMTGLIETTRAFEAYQKTLQVLQQQDSQITSKLGSL